MRLLISFILALISYILILFLLYFLFPKSTSIQSKEVLIHTAIVKPIITKNKIKKNIIQKNSLKERIQEKKEIKKIINKTKAKSAVTKSGDVKFNDIFKNVKANVPTTPVHLKKQLVISRFKGNDVLKNISKIKTLNIKISYQTNKKSSNIKKNDVNKFINKVTNIWYDISNIAGEYAIIKIIVNNGRVNAVILETNLNNIEQKMLIKEIDALNFNKNIELTIKFQTKVNK